MEPQYAILMAIGAIGAGGSLLASAEHECEGAKRQYAHLSITFVLVAVIGAALAS